MGAVKLFWGTVLLAWASVAAFSIFSQVNYLVDAWAYIVSFDNALIGVLSVIGKAASAAVAQYRVAIGEIYNFLMQTLSLPEVPQAVKDGVGVAVFSIARAGQVRRTMTKRGTDILEQLIDMVHAGHTDRDFDGGLDREAMRRALKGKPLMKLSLRITRILGTPFLKLPLGPRVQIRWMLYAISNTLVYGGAVAFWISALFAADWLYVGYGT